MQHYTVAPAYQTRDHRCWQPLSWLGGLPSETTLSRTRNKHSDALGRIKIEHREGLDEDEVVVAPSARVRDHHHTWKMSSLIRYSRSTQRAANVS